MAERGEEGKKWKQGEGERKKRRGSEKEKRAGKRGEEGPRRVKLVLRRLPGGLTDEELRELLEEIVVKVSEEGGWEKDLERDAYLPPRGSRRAFSPPHRRRPLPTRRPQLR